MDEERTTLMNFAGTGKIAKKKPVITKIRKLTVLMLFFVPNRRINFLLSCPGRWKRGNILTGYICQYVGWEYIFYIYGNHFYQILILSDNVTNYLEKHRFPGLNFFELLC